MRQSYLDQARGSVDAPPRVPCCARRRFCRGLSATASAQTAPAPPKAKPTAPAAQAPPRRRVTCCRGRLTPQRCRPRGRSSTAMSRRSAGARQCSRTLRRTRSGTMSMPSSGVSGTLDVYAAKPNKSFVKLTLGGIGEVLEGFDGTVGWSLSPMTGPMLTSGKELEQKKFDADFYGDLHDRGRYKSMQTLEKTTFEGRPCYKVSLVTRRTATEDIEFYDVADRPQGRDASPRAIRRWGPCRSRSRTATTRSSAICCVPTTMKQSTMGVQQVLTFTSVEFDNVPPSMFEPPAAIKALSSDAAGVRASARADGVTPRRRWSSRSRGDSAPRCRTASRRSTPPGRSSATRTSTGR